MTEEKKAKKPRCYKVDVNNYKFDDIETFGGNIEGDVRVTWDAGVSLSKVRKTLRLLSTKLK